MAAQPILPQPHPLNGLRLCCGDDGDDGDGGDDEDGDEKWCEVRGVRMFEQLNYRLL